MCDHYYYFQAPAGFSMRDSGSPISSHKDEASVSFFSFAPRSHFYSV